MDGTTRGGRGGKGIDFFISGEIAEPVIKNEERPTVRNAVNLKLGN